MKALFMVLLVSLLSSVWAATGQVGVYVMAPSPSPTPSPEMQNAPAPITGFAVAVSNDRNFFDVISDILKSILKPFGLSH